MTLKTSIFHKLEILKDRYQELSLLLSQKEVIEDQPRFRKFSKEYADLEVVVETFKTYQMACEAFETVQSLLKDPDPEIRLLAEEEFTALKAEIEEQAEKLEILLLPKDPNDTANIFLEIRAGTGGDEAAIFVGDLARMYLRFAESQGWQTETINQSVNEQGGFKEIILRICGQEVYANLKFESGAHRVQRVPVTESQGRVHTSACTVAIMPEVETVDSIEIDPSELRIDTYRASGAGGQHVNRTDSAVRITHLPTGTVSECQEERSQHKNKAKALSLLRAKLLSAEQNKQAAAQAKQRRNLVGSGDRSERIRTYNYPQGRITDHRINLTLYKLPEMIEGDLMPVIAPLRHEHQMDLLSSLSDE